MNIEHRVFIGEIRNINESNRSFEHPISDETPDGHGSIMKVDGWDLTRFKANPIVLFAHDSLGLPIGRSIKIWQEGKRLMSRTQFAGLDQTHDFAEKAYRLVKDGFLRAWSVGFLAKEKHPREDLTDREKSQLSDPYVYTRQELMEYSLVPVPSNPNALMNAAVRRDFEDLKELALKNQPPLTFYGAMVQEIERAVTRHMFLGTMNCKSQMSRHDADRFMSTRSPFGPSETTVREFFNVPEKDSRETESSIQVMYRNLGETLNRIEDRRSRRGA
jgi:HK97 family phage prohead protease